VHDATLALARGEHGRALAGFARYLRDNPRGALVEDARAGTMDARWRMGDRAGARLAAERYLTEFPRGVAGQRARRIVTETSAQP
jgi:outer membrane protein assembly factor BamD (BamD/ComL family)